MVGLLQCGSEWHEPNWLDSQTNPTYRCLDLYDSWGCRFISVTSQNNLQYWYVLIKGAA